MNKDRIEGKVKDVAGRVERQAGEWTDDPKKQVEGAAKQVEGKLQNTVGELKDLARKASDDIKSPTKPPQRAHDTVEDEEDSEEAPRSRR